MLKRQKQHIWWSVIINTNVRSKMRGFNLTAWMEEKGRDNSSCLTVFLPGALAFPVFRLKTGILTFLGPQTTPVQRWKGTCSLIQQSLVAQEMPGAKHSARELDEIWQLGMWDLELHYPRSIPYSQLDLGQVAPSAASLPVKWMILTSQPCQED